MYCGLHGRFLVKEPLSCDKPCCVNGCTRSSRWSCLGRGDPCSHSVYMRHGYNIITGDQVINIEVDMHGERLCATRNDRLTGDADGVDNDDNISVLGMQMMTMMIL